MDATVTIALVLVGALIAMLLIAVRCTRPVPPNRALVLSRSRGDSEVSFKAKLVLPFVHRAELMSLETHSVAVELRGDRAPRAQDGVRMDVEASFQVRVNATTEEVLTVARTIGCARASDVKSVAELFHDKFAEALHSTIATVNSDTAFHDIERLRDQAINMIGMDLNGFRLDDAAIHTLGITPIEQLDASDPLDAQAIRLITSRTAEETKRANEMKHIERMEITSQDLKASEAIYDLERRKAEAEANMQRDIAIARAREEAAAELVRIQEAKNVQLRRIEEETNVHLRRIEMLEALATHEERLEEALASAQRLKKQAQLMGAGSEAREEWKKVPEERKLSLKELDEKRAQELKALEEKQAQGLEALDTGDQ